MNRATEYLKDICERLEKVVIENKDFEGLVKTYDRPTALFYVDPPYVGTEKYYNGQFTYEDHKRLNRILSSIKGRFILSYNDCEFIRELYKDFHIIEVSRKNLLAGKAEARGEFKELIIRNY